MNEKSFLIIPYSIIGIEDLSLSEKLVLCEVISLSKSTGYCYASNRFISSRTSVKPNTVSISINKLKRKEYLVINTVEQQRRIYINRDKFKNTTLSIFDYTISDFDNSLLKSDSPLSKNHTNKKNYKTRNKKSNKRAHRSDASYDIEELMKIK